MEWFKPEDSIFNRPMKIIGPTQFKISNLGRDEQLACSSNGMKE